MITAVLLASFGACATTSERAAVPAVQPFLAAGRFVPRGMTSFACERGGILLADIDAKYVVSAGRDFEPPEDLGIGLSRTIWIADVGGSGARDALQRNLRQWETEEFAIGDTPCWRAAPARNRFDVDLWCTTVDDRFVLVALKRDVLVEALARESDLVAELVPFGDLAFLPADATDLMFLLPRIVQLPSSSPLPSPDGPIVGVLRPTPWRLTMFSRVPLPEAYGGFLAELFSSVSAPVHLDRWWVSRGVLHEQAPLHATTGLGGSWLRLFGHRIFL